MENYCGANCNECQFKNGCRGCFNTCGKPFGGECVAATCIKNGGIKEFEKVKKVIIERINNLNIENLSVIKELYCLKGSYVNLEYSLPSGEKIKFLDDNSIYLGTQVESKNDRCFGIVANMDFIIVCSYGYLGANPKLIVYKKY